MIHSDTVNHPQPSPKNISQFGITTPIYLQIGKSQWGTLRCDPPMVGKVQHRCAQWFMEPLNRAWRWIFWEPYIYNCHLLANLGKKRLQPQVDRCSSCDTAPETDGDCMLLPDKKELFPTALVLQLVVLLCTIHELTPRKWTVDGRKASDASIRCRLLLFPFVWEGNGGPSHVKSCRMMPTTTSIWFRVGFPNWLSGVQMANPNDPILTDHAVRQLKKNSSHDMPQDFA